MSCHEVVSQTRQSFPLSSFRSRQTPGFLPSFIRIHPQSSLLKKVLLNIYEQNLPPKFTPFCDLSETVHISSLSSPIKIPGKNTIPLHYVRAVFSAKVTPLTCFFSSFPNKKEDCVFAIFSGHPSFLPAV